jgi:hypothetical protein
MTLGHEQLDVYGLSIVNSTGFTRRLSRPGGRGYQVPEDRTISGDKRNDFDPDFDSDLDEVAKVPQPSVACDR